MPNSSVSAQTHPELILTFWRQSSFHLHTMALVLSASYTAFPLFDDVLLWISWWEAVINASYLLEQFFFGSPSHRRSLYFDLTPDIQSPLQPLLFSPLVLHYGSAYLPFGSKYKNCFMCVDFWAHFFCCCSQCILHFSRIWQRPEGNSNVMCMSQNPWGFSFYRPFQNNAFLP
jgi:hypothetical protein